MKKEQAPACCPKGHNSANFQKSLKLFIALLLAAVFLLPANVSAQCSLSATVTGTNPTACGQCNGSVTANPSGGASPYTYLWSNGFTTQSVGQGVVSGTRKFIDCGNTSASFIASTGDTFLVDQNFSGGTSFSNAVAIANTTDDALYQNEHFVGTSGFFSYNIPVSNGNYTVDLYFAEIFFGTPGHPGGVGSRKFDVSIQGTLVLDDYDIFADAGGAATAKIKTFSTTVTNNSLTILFKGVVNNAKINAIGVKPAQANGLCPGTYTVTVTDASHCTAVASTTLTGSGCNDNSLCTTDECINNACTHTNIDCNDNSACTDDACIAASGCQHTTHNCSDNDGCTTDLCDAAAGCSHQPKDCNDHNTCTNDGCSDGNCTHTTINCDDNDGCTTDACTDGACKHTDIPGCNDPCFGIVCNDDEPCTQDACVGGGCVFTHINCADNDLCTQDECIDGDCFNFSDNCDDANVCTQDICLGNGFCSHQNINCDDNIACTIDGCNNGCTHTAMVCNDNISCTDDACVDGQCVSTSKNCSDGDDCTEDACDNGACKHTAINCTDSDKCTDDACTGGHCVFTPINCADGNSCTDDFCEEGFCFSTNISCNDNNTCTDDGCNNGQCIFTQKDCNDHTACTADNCTDGTCGHTTLNCNDGNNCTDDGCDNGQCVHTPKNCSDNIACTTDNCVDNNCTHSTIVCNDNNSCTNDNCDNGQCVYTPISCDDGIGCTIDGCNNGCTHTAKVCDDANSCTTNACDNGTCVYTPISCDDGIACTTDGCNNGCTHTQKVCNDNIACTTDACADGNCTFTTISCDDLNACTTDNCNNGTCTHTNICNPCTLEVISFTLINSATDVAIGSLEDGSVINLFNTPNVNVKANLCQEPVGSVKFNLNGPTFRIESTAPYALAGDAPVGDYSKWNVTPGTYTLHAIPYPNAGATGTQGISKTITFTVINQQVECTTDIQCSDNNACTNEVCQNGSCVRTPANCDDNDACTTDGCSGGCTHVAISCADDNTCTDDGCNAVNGCTHSPVANCCNTAGDCNDNNLCTTDACNEAHQCTNTQAASGPSYLHIVNTAKSYRKLKLGYSSTNLFIPKNNVVAGGNTMMCVTLRGSAGTEWSRLQIRPQGSISAPVSLGGYGLGTSFTEICIPLSAFGPSVDFTKLTLIEMPYNNGAGPFELDIQKIEFRGDATSTPFLWFGGSKTDNYHDGNTTATLAATLVAGNPCGGGAKRESDAIEMNTGTPTTQLQAYPNPFSDKLTIEFTIAEDSDVKLEIYNITGQQLATLFDGKMTSGESQKVEYAPATVANGMYVYRLQTKSGIYFGKAVMQK